MRLIDADDLISNISSMRVYVGGKDITDPEYRKSVLTAIDEAPTVDAIVSPVSIGQTVWAIEFYRGKPIAIHEDKVQMVGYTSRSIKILLRNHHDFNKAFVLDKTVFTTYKAAEAALKARENECTEE